MPEKHFKIRVTNKKTGKVISYLKLVDNDRFVYDLFTGYLDINGEEIYTNDKIQFYFNGEAIRESGVISKEVFEIDFMAIDKKNTGLPLVFMDKILKLSEKEEEKT